MRPEELQKAIEEKRVIKASSSPLRGSGTEIEEKRVIKVSSPLRGSTGIAQVAATVAQSRKSVKSLR